MSRPRLLDLYSGAGGAAVGYGRAGFDVTGVDIRPMPRYPFAFHQADALEYLAEHGRTFDVIHASPPCQAYSCTRGIGSDDRAHYGRSVHAVRARLVQTGRPWIIENVQGARLHSGIVLCGLMFGLRVYRHRVFESSLMLLAPPHITHRERITPPGKRLGYCSTEVGGMVTAAGHLFTKASGSAAMGIDWMTRDELAESIPPAYTEFVGRQVLTQIEAAPAWVSCETCEDFWCRIHELHAFDCACPSVEEWDADPYMVGGPPSVQEGDR